MSEKIRHRKRSKQQKFYLFLTKKKKNIHEKIKRYKIRFADGKRKTKFYLHPLTIIICICRIQYDTIPHALHPHPLPSANSLTNISNSNTYIFHLVHHTTIYQLC